MKHIMYSLENCQKCNYAKDLLSGREDIEYITLPHDMKKWTEPQRAKVEAYNVFDHLRRTAPIFVILPSEKILVGYLDIKRALDDGLI